VTALARICSGGLQAGGFLISSVKPPA